MGMPVSSSADAIWGCHNSEATNVKRNAIIDSFLIFYPPKLQHHFNKDRELR